jgi:diguanylate cyclase (GGDEF)-like protein
MRIVMVGRDDANASCCRDIDEEKRIKRHDLHDLMRVTWPLLVVIAGLLGLGGVGLYLLGGARGYVAGESIWSKAQKEASIHLDRYAARGGSERDYQRYRDTISIVLADRRARLALDQPKPDVALAYASFAEAGNHRSEIPAMIDLYRYLGTYPTFARAIAVWRDADAHIMRMDALAAELHAEIAAGAREGTVTAELRAELTAIDAALTPLEHRFSATVSEAARELRLLLAAGILTLAVVLAIWALLISRNMLRRLTDMAQYDPLTRLPNRHSFEQSLKQALLRARRDGRMVGVLFFDLDGFKQINDSLGHSAGDEVLVEIGRRLRESLREGDTVARLGGDEFVVIVEGIADAEAARVVGRAALGVCVPPVKVRRREMFVTASMGIALFPGDGEEADTLLMHADTAMYRAKREARNELRFYATEMSDAVNERLGLEGQLRRAIECSELEVYYQPIIELRNGTVVTMEALLRWHHPEWGLTAPVRFMEVAEQTGLIVRIGAWVMQQACAQARLWNHRSRGPIPVAVNLSARQFREHDLVEATREALARHQIAGSLLHVEITETVVMENLEESTRQLLELRAMGVKVALDDFGTGHSSMAYLKHFPLDEVKIDRSFVQDISNQEKDVAIVKAIIALAHTLDLTVTGEGVETAEQLAHLRGLGCDNAQGFLLGMPLPASEAAILLDTTNALVKRPLAAR